MSTTPLVCDIGLTKDSQHLKSLGGLYNKPVLEFVPLMSSCFLPTPVAFGVSTDLLHVAQSSKC
ncbi:hypothetical protein M404DRAFT_26479 [Pisolithus tinctorius Marx 270]|uniref:Uncharacterized protein n=1 Tax=Pisolithus tinctorius Marx 270 TaxID=870435 RepID=A0A0C3K400_PISTI|nr:hypothetical protein M404DRAFT_26479 [Pisolithus tinctorius Marx 270]